MSRIKKFVKKSLGSKIPLKFSKGNRFIFVFHDISNENEPHHSPLYSTTISRFEEQLNLINELFEIIPLDRIVSDKKLDEEKNYVAIHFDDGFYSVIEHARPLLKKKNIPYSVFLNGAAIEENQLWVSNLEIYRHEKSYVEKLLRLASVKIAKNEHPVLAIVRRGKFGNDFKEGYQRKDQHKKIYMNREDLQLLSEEGVTVGNHSTDHFVLSGCEQEMRNSQVLENLELLKKITNQKINHFALPHGGRKPYCNDTISMIKNLGHGFIYTTTPNRFRESDLDDKNFLFPRIAITNETPKQLLFYINRALYKNHDL